MMSGVSQSESRRRVQLILQQLDQLPTLSSTAIRLLEVTSSETSHARDVIQLVANDPSLSSKVLQLCRRASRGVKIPDGSIDRAVILLGFEEVRALALAVEVFELLDGVVSSGGQAFGEETVFDRAAFWQHCLAVAYISEAIVSRTGYRRTMSTGEAFLAGLLHDLGQLALYTVLPRTFDRICAIAESRGVSLDTVARRTVGATTHTLGKHLAEHWQLPRAILEVTWLCEQPAESIPETECRDLVRIVTFADALARRHLLTHTGHGQMEADLDEMARQLKLKPPVIEQITAVLHDEVAARAASIGLGEPTGNELLRGATERALQLLERRVEGQRAMTDSLQARARLINAAQLFYDHTMPGDSLTTVARAALESAALIFGDGRAGVLVLNSRKHRAELFLRGADGHLRITESLRMPEDFTVDPGNLFAATDSHAVAVHVFPFIADDGHDPDISRWNTVPLEIGPDVAAFHVRPKMDAGNIDAGHLNVLYRMWGSALCATVLEERAGGLSEQLVEANRRLVDAQELLAEKRAMAALGELASGAAHEMNNPLTVISGRSQILSRRVSEPDLKAAAEEIVRQSHRLSDLITSLALYAESPLPKRQAVDLAELVNAAVREVRDRSESDVNVRMSLPDDLPTAFFDRTQMIHVLRELLQNAQEAAPGEMIELRVQIDPLDDRLSIMVIDNGSGLSERAMAHAFDPFFSEKPAGRQPGLGLARARRLAELNRGEIELKNGPAGGTVATVFLDEWRADQGETRFAA